MKMKRIVALLLVFTMVCSLAACGGGGSNGSGDSAAVESARAEGQDLLASGVVQTDYVADEVKLVGNNASATLYPWGTDISSSPLFSIYEKLFDFEEYGGDMSAVLADCTKGEFEGYDHEEGSSDYTVYIYDNIYDHAGNHITADDVKFSYDKQVALEKPGATPWPDYVSVDVVDEYTVVFHFSREMTGLDDLTNFWPNCFIISEKAFKDSLGTSTDEKSALVTDACGTGPYKLTSYVSGSDIVLEKYEDYWQTNDDVKLPTQFANVKKITYVAATETSQQILALRTGELDLVNEVPTDSLSQFFGEGKTGYNLITWAQSGQRYVAANCDSASICSDVNMRLAIFYAIDVAGVVQALGGESSAMQCFGLFGSEQDDTNPEWANWDNYQTKTDSSLVKEYLDAAGYKGETLNLIAGKKEQTMAQIVLNQLNEAGIKAELQVLDDTSFDNTREQPGDWDILVNRNSGWCGAVSASRNWLPSSRYGDRTATFVDDQEWFDLMNLILTVDGHTTENIDAWQQMAIDNAYAIGIYSLVNNIVFSNKIQTIVRNGKNIPIPGGFTYADPNA